MLYFLILSVIGFADVGYAIEATTDNFCIARKKVYVGSNDIMSSDCKFIKNEVFCDSLNDVITQNLNLTNTCIYLLRNQTLRHGFLLNSVQNVALIGLTTDISIDCGLSYENATDIGIGFDIKASYNLYFANISVMNCGQRQPIDVCSEFGFNTTSQSAFHFTNTEDISFEKVNIFYSIGYGIFMSEIGGKVLLSEFTVGHNVLAPFILHNGTTLDGFTSGGGINIILLNSSVSSGLLITIKRSIFTNNTAETEDHTQLCKSNFSFPFGRGGGISLSIHGKVQNVKLSIGSSSIFRMNKALWGGGINFKTASHSSSSTLTVDNTSITDNYAKLAGAGIFAMDIDGDQNNKVTIRNTEIKRNTATCGGGVALYGALARVSANIYETHIKFNAAFMGSGIFLRSAVLTISNVSLSKNNKHWHGAGAYGAVAYGALASFNSDIHCFNLNKVSRNKKTGIVLDKSTIHVYDVLSIEKNNGYDGGGMALYGDSQLKPYEYCKISFLKNHAANRGGAIYADIPGPMVQPLDTHLLNRYKCLIDLNKEDFTDPNFCRIYFDQNTADEGRGDAIFAKTLQNCRNTYTYDFKKIFTKWQWLVFKPYRSPYSVVTSARNITLIPEQWKPIPGFPFSPNIYLYDERNQSVTQAVSIIPTAVHNHSLDVYVKDHSNDFLLTNNSFQPILNGRSSSRCNIEVTVPNSEVLPQTISNITMHPCTYGFIMKNDSDVCDCDTKRNTPLTLQCVYRDLYITQYYWIYNKHSTSSIVCPLGYCKTCAENETLTGFECLFNFEKQCGKNRDEKSLLCSKCLRNYSVPIGSNECTRCTVNTGMNILACIGYVLFVLFLEIGIMCLNCETYQNSILSLVFFYKCSSTITYSLATMDPDKNLKLVFGNYAVSFPFSDVSFCMQNGLNNLTKFTWLYLIACTYPVTLIVLYLWVVFARKLVCCPFRSWFTYDAFWRTYNAFIMLFWFDIVHQSFTVLHSAEINGASRVWIYANAIWGGKEHLPYAIIAIIALFFCFIFFTLMMIFVLQLPKEPNDDKRWQRAIRKLRKFRILRSFDAFKIGLKINYEIVKKKPDGNEEKEYVNRGMYVIFYMLVYVAVVSISLFVDPLIRATLLSIMFLILAILVLLSRPFEQFLMNCFEVYIISSICFLCLLKDCMQALYCPTEEVYKQVSGPCVHVPRLITAITLLPAVILSTYFVALSRCFSKCRKKIREILPGNQNNNDQQIEEILYPSRPDESSDEESD